MTRFGFISQLAIRASYGFVGSIDRNALPFSVLRKVGNLTYDGEKIMDRYDPSNPFDQVAASGKSEYWF